MLPTTHNRTSDAFHPALGLIGRAGFEQILRSIALDDAEAAFAALHQLCGIVLDTLTHTSQHEMPSRTEQMEPSSAMTPVGLLSPCFLKYDSMRCLIAQKRLVRFRFPVLVWVLAKNATMRLRRVIALAFALLLLQEARRLRPICERALRLLHTSEEELRKDRQRAGQAERVAKEGRTHACIAHG